MNRQELLKRITVDPNICFGKPVIKGTRIWVSLIVSSLAGGATEAELLVDYPSLTSEDVHSALAYAAIIAHERVVELPQQAA